MVCFLHSALESKLKINRPGLCLRLVIQLRLSPASLNPGYLHAGVCFFEGKNEGQKSPINGNSPQLLPGCFHGGI